MRFYFTADKLDRALDGLILSITEKAAEGVRNCEYYADKICAVIEDKAELKKLWNYLNNVISEFGVKEAEILKFYALSHKSIVKLPENVRKSVKSAAVKFSRRAYAVKAYEREVKVADKYCCLFN